MALLACMLASSSLLHALPQEPAVKPAAAAHLTVDGSGVQTVSEAVWGFDCCE